MHPALHYPLTVLSVFLLAVVGLTVATNDVWPVKYTALGPSPPAPRYRRLGDWMRNAVGRSLSSAASLSSAIETTDRNLPYVELRLPGVTRRIFRVMVDTGVVGVHLNGSALGRWKIRGLREQTQVYHSRLLRGTRAGGEHPNPLKQQLCPMRSSVEAWYPRKLQVGDTIYRDVPVYLNGSPKVPVREPNWPAGLDGVIGLMRSQVDDSPRVACSLIGLFCQDRTHRAVMFNFTDTNPAAHQIRMCLPSDTLLAEGAQTYPAARTDAAWQTSQSLELSAGTSSKDLQRVGQGVVLRFNPALEAIRMDIPLLGALEAPMGLQLNPHDYQPADPTESTFGDLPDIHLQLKWTNLARAQSILLDETQLVRTPDGQKTKLMWQGRSSGFGYGTGAQAAG
ncbi:hypothetical protein IWQ60_004241 [Tieghemiomyces parasiticus]|uniref:Uncharacterized protein n=1 Tax=Tieghemiomyces parasiticus TaxID=78921 RepID=A0A9W8ABS2_9FUNG|nr:hypothetical protein IWQ60_004241 [Tieghemiomyces parasiticus]